MTKMMTAIEITQPGDADVLKPVTLPRPEIKDNELLIRVAAAGVNRPDIMQRRGLYPAPKGASPLPGLEISGTVVDCGAAVTGWQKGDQLCALLSGGGYSEYCAVPMTQCLPIPDGVSLIEAATLPETYFTIWSNVFDRGGLKSGEIFMVHGGTSGIGTTAIQMAKAFGATVITTSGSDEKADFCRTLGADLAINYKTEDFAESVKSYTGGRGVDVLLDMIAGDYIKRNFMVMAPEGRIVMIAVQRGPKIKANILPIMLKRLTFTGSTLRGRDQAFKAAIRDNLVARVWPLFKTGQMRPVVDRTFPLTDASAAHRYLESGTAMGKIVLEV